MGKDKQRSNTNSLSDMEQQFIENLYIKNVTRLFGYAFRMLNDRELAEEAVQSTFCDACVKVAMLMKHPNPEGWIRSALKLTIKNISNSKTRGYNLLFKMKSVYLSDILELNVNIEPDILYANLVNNKDYMLLKSYAEAECTVEEFAIQLGITTDACNKRIQRARKRIKKYIENL